MSSLTPIKLYSCAGGPNPWKVAMILEELSVPYETTYLDFPSMKETSFTALNPNGRVPAIVDPNTNITLWESSAIVEYLISTYDKSHSLCYEPNSADDWHCKQWLAFQISGQGPYYGQAVWFTNYQKIPEARQRYLKEIERTISVLDAWLAREDGSGFLVGGKLTYADVSFVPWAALVEWVFALVEEDKGRYATIRETYPTYAKWLDGMMEREAVKKVWETRAKVMAEQH